jgi:amino acid adenylation domain-containing protein
MLEDSNAKIVIGLEDNKEKISINCQLLTVNCELKSIPELQGPLYHSSFSVHHSNQLAYIIYTSGSTGKPKGVMVPHEGISNRLHWMQEAFELTDYDRVLQKTPFSFDVSVWEFFWPLTAGAVLVMAKPGGHKDSAYLVEVINKFGITTIHFVPAMLNVFLEDPGFGGILCLKRVICSGEALPAEYRDRFYARLHPGARTELHNLYGPTEASVDVTAWACDREDKRHVVPIGRPISNTQIYILDKNQNPVPVGVYGELCIAGIQLARGYINRPELTAERFSRSYRSYRTNIFYRTGDLTRWLPDGTIEFIGRLDFQVKVRGFRIELGEIESALRSYPGVDDAAVLPWEEPADSGGKKLVAYVVPGNRDQYLADEQIGDWQDVFNDTYTKDSGQSDPIFNIIGWNSSYTGAPIPAEEMRIWVDCTVERILGLKPQRVLEIGCGTGLFLFPITPHCVRYLGSDIASQGLNYIRSRLEQLKTTGKATGWAEVELLKRAADNFEGLQAEELDLVFLNSVVQYFPTVDYLVKVIKGAVEVLKPSGHIFLGDVRSLPLLKPFHASVEFHRAEAGVNREQLHRRVMSRMALEQELVIDPGFFHTLQQQVPAVKEVEILVKYGRYSNELSKFRYDVILHLHDHPISIPSFRLDWKQDKPGIPELREWLRELAQNPTEPGPILISGIADSRTAVDMNLLRWLSGSDEATTVGQFREAMANVKESAIDPQDFLELAKDIPYDIALTPSPLDTGAFHAVCWFRGRDTGNEGSETAGGGILSPEDKGEAVNSLLSYANNPLLVKISAQLAPELRGYLKERLPEYMVPSNFVLLDRLPLTSSGKLNRRALPEPGQVMQEMENSFVEPTMPLEILLVEIWQRVLNLEKVGVKNNFFELGGDSIKAIQVVSRVNKEGYPITVQHLYLNQNIADLAVTAAKMQNSGTGAGTFNISEQELIMDIDRKILLDQLPAGTEIEDILPVTPQQRHMLETLEMYEQSGKPDPGLFVIHKKYLPRRFNLDPDILRQVLAKVVAHRALLRSAFIRHGLQEPVQVICKEGEIPLTYRDLSHLPPPEQQEQFNEFIREEWRRGFDRTRPNAVRMGLVKFGEGHFQFFFTSDYIRFDGWSSGIIQNEVVYCYNMLAVGSDLKLREEHQYKYYLAALKKEDIGTAEKYWRSIFQGYEPPSGSLIDRFPCNSPRSANGFARQFVYLSPETTGIIDNFLQRFHLVHSSLIFAIWAMLLSRYTEETDIVFGVIYSGRTIAAASGIEGMVGNTINVLPMRITIDPQRIVLNWLQEIFNHQIEANKYEYTPLRKIKEWCGLSPQKPMFETYIVMQNLPSPNPEDTVDDKKVVKMLTDMGAGKKLRGAGELPPDRKEYELFFAKMEYPLRVDIYTPGQFCPVFNYERSRFADSVVKGYMENMVALMESIVANPYQSVEELLGQINPEKYPIAETLPFDYV